MKVNITCRKAAYLLSLFILSAVMLYMLPETLGGFARMLGTSDSAVAASFNVEITVPEELENSEKGQCQYYFPTEQELKAFNFKVTNNGETTVVCTPYISNDIQYRVYVADAVKTEFIVGIGEMVSFWIVITADGLSFDTTDAVIAIDIQQAEGG